MSGKPCDEFVLTTMPALQRLQSVEGIPPRLHPRPILRLRHSCPSSCLIWHAGQSSLPVSQKKPIMAAVLTGYFQASYLLIVTVNLNDTDVNDVQLDRELKRYVCVVIVLKTFKVCYNNCFHDFIYLYFMFYSNTYWIVCFCHNNK